MASPFNVFRKNQRAWIAVIGVLTMFAFVLLPPIIQRMGSQTGTQGPSKNVFTTKNGAVSKYQFDKLKQQRDITNNFVRLIQIKLNQNPQPYGQPTKEEVETTYLLVEKAKELGIYVSDKAINDKIRSLHNGKLSKEEITDIINNLGQDRNRVSAQDLFDGLRYELMARRAYELLVGGLNIDPPAQLWEYYRRRNQKATIELIPIHVADFIDDVDDPSKEELNTYFNKYKDRYAERYEDIPPFKDRIEGRYLDSPEPGFRQPPRAAFQYVKADYNEFLETAKSLVTKKEIEEYYKKNKEDYKKFELPNEEDETPDGQDQGKTKNKDLDDQSKNKQGAQQENSPKKKDDPKEKINKKDPKKKPAKKKGSPSDGDARKDAKTSLRINVTQTMSAQLTQNKVKTGKQAESPEKAKTSDSKKTAKKTEAGQASAEKTPVKSSKTDGKKPDTASDQGDSKSKETEAGKKDEKTEEKKQPQYQPLEEVEQEIRKILVTNQDRVNKMIADALSEPKNDMRDYNEKYEDWDFDKQRKGEKPPNPLNDEYINKINAELSKKYANKEKTANRDEEKTDTEGQKQSEPKGKKPPTPEKSEKQSEVPHLSLHTTELLSRREIQEQGGLGKSSVDQTRGFGIQFINFAYGGGAKRLRLFEPKISSDFTSYNEYLFWKIDEKPKENEDPKEPDLKDVRQQVIRAWKSGAGMEEKEIEGKALDLARKEAQRLADIARKKRKPLSQIFGKAPTKEADKKSPDPDPQKKQKAKNNPPGAADKDKDSEEAKTIGKDTSDKKEKIIGKTKSSGENPTPDKPPLKTPPADKTKTKTNAEAVKQPEKKKANQPEGEVKDKAADQAKEKSENKTAQNKKDQTGDSSEPEYPGVTVLSPVTFSWMDRARRPKNLPDYQGWLWNQRSASFPPELSPVFLVDHAGPDFMKVVFSLKPGEVGIAENHPKTVVYVVRMRSLYPSVERMMQNFVKSPNVYQTSRVGSWEKQAINTLRMKQIQMDFDFKEEPEAKNQGGSGSR